FRIRSARSGRRAVGSIVSLTPRHGPCRPTISRAGVVRIAIRLPVRGPPPAVRRALRVRGHAGREILRLELREEPDIARDLRIAEQRLLLEPPPVRRVLEPAAA